MPESVIVVDALTGEHQRAGECPELHEYWQLEKGVTLSGVQGAVSGWVGRCTYGMGAISLL